MHENYTSFSGQVFYSETDFSLSYLRKSENEKCHTATLNRWQFESCPE